MAYEFTVTAMGNGRYSLVRVGPDPDIAMYYLTEAEARALADELASHGAIIHGLEN